MRAKIAPLVKWTISVALLLIVLMSLMRLVFFFMFPHQNEQHLFSAFMLGVRYDMRMAAIIVLPVFLIGNLQIKYHLNRYTTGTKVRLVLSLLFVVGVLLFLRNNKGSVADMIIICGVYGIILFLLFYLKDLNAYANPVAKKIWSGYFLIAIIVVTFLYVVDLQHYDYLHQRLNASVLGYTADAKISMQMAWQTYPVIRILLVIILSATCIFYLIRKLYATFNVGYRSINTRSSVITSVIFFLLLSMIIYGRISRYPLRWSDAYTLGSDYKANLALNPLQSFFSSLRFKNSAPDIRKVKDFYSLMCEYLGVKNRDSARLNYEREYTANGSSQHQPNVVLVICESFSGYKSSMWGNTLNTTPFFNQLCSRGIFFDHCFTPTYGTARGVWAVITGVPDVEPAPNTASRNPAAVDQRTIINDFKGYEKYYFLGGSTSWANIRGLLTNNIEGLHLYEEGSYNSPVKDVWGISDKNLFLEANGVLKKETKPFFAVIQTSGNHRPYTIPEEDKDFKSVIYPKDTLLKHGFEGNDELNAFRYSDYCFQKFMEAATREQYFSNTIFVFVGDHGIAGTAGPEFPKSYTELGLTKQHVPLLFYAPLLLAPRRDSAVASQVDVVPSIAGLAGISYKNYTLGKNLFSNDSIAAKPGSAAFLYDPDNRIIGVVLGDYAYVRHQEDGKETIQSIRNNLPVADSVSKIQLPLLRRLTTGWYETARYMLLNNKK